MDVENYFVYDNDLGKTAIFVRIRLASSAFGGWIMQDTRLLVGSMMILSVYMPRGGYVRGGLQLSSLRRAEVKWAQH